MSYIFFQVKFNREGFVFLAEYLLGNSTTHLPLPSLIYIARIIFYDFVKTRFNVDFIVTKLVSTIKRDL